MIRLTIIPLMATLLSAAAVAQAPSPSPPATDLRLFASSADVKALIAKAAAAIKPGQPALVQPLLAFAPYSAALEYRQAGAGAARHGDQAEIFFVVQGGGTFVQGGTLTEPKQTDPQNSSGSGIAGGETRHVGVGDMFVVPEATPHWVSAVDGRLVMISMKVPRGAAAR